MTDAEPEPSVPRGLEGIEMAVLSAILIDGSLDGLGNELLAEDFSNPKAALVFRAATAVHGQGRKIDPHSLYRELERQGAVEAAGGFGFIGYLIDMVPTSASLANHAQIVLDAARTRAAHRHLNHLANLASEGRVLPGDLADRIESVAETLRGRSGGTHFQLLSEVEISGLQPAAPLIEGVAFAESLIVLVGRYGTMKTFVLLDLALCIATGNDWHGRRATRGSVVYVCAEGSRGIPNRVAAWRAARQYEGPLDIHFLPRSVLMTNGAQVGRLITSIRKTGIQPVAVFLDTLARNMDGDEQKAVDIGAFVRGCDRLREAFGVAVFVAHHTGWVAVRSRGSTSLPGATDTEILLERKDAILTLSCTKQKDAEEFEPIVLEAFPIAGSLALRRGARAPHPCTANESRLLAALGSTPGMTSTAWRNATGLVKSSFDFARRRLMEAGFVVTTARLYSITDAGRGVLGTRDNSRTVAGQPGTPDGSREPVQLRRTLAPEEQ